MMKTPREDQAIGGLYTLKEAQEATGEDRNLITYLITDRDIPVKAAGMAKVIDDHGLKLLKAAIADYRAKVGPSRPRSQGKKRRGPATALTSKGG